MSDPDRWDLAVAGLHKRQTGTGKVKRLKHVIIQFDSQNSKRTSDLVFSVGGGSLIMGKIFRSSLPSSSRSRP